MALQIILNQKKSSSALLRPSFLCTLISLSGAISAPAESHDNTTARHRIVFPNYNDSCNVRWHRCACGAVAAAGTFFGSFFVQAKKEQNNSKS